MTGQDLIKIIQSKNELNSGDIKYTLLFLLKNKFIYPSDIINLYTDLLNDEVDKLKSHYDEGCLCTDLMLYGNDAQKEWAIKRAKFNACNCKNIPYNYNLTEDEIKECSTLFETTYGFNPLNTK